MYITRGSQIIRDHDGRDNNVSADQLIFLPKEVYLVSDFTINGELFEAYLFFIDDHSVDRYLASTPELRQVRDREDVAQLNGQTYTLNANEQAGAMHGSGPLPLPIEPETGPDDERAPGRGCLG